MELSDNDRQRIEQAADEYAFVECNQTYAENLGFVKGAEYATRYEREQQAPLLRELEEFKNGNLMDEYTVELSDKVERLEAERTELHKEIADLKAWKQSEIQIWRPIIEYMHSNGHLFGMKLGESINEKVLEVLRLNSLKK